MGANNKQALALLSVVLLMSFAICLNNTQDSTTLVPAIIIFGDSAADVGNNDYILTLFKANYPPYGRDIVTHQPTGRFCNGKLVTDMTDAYLDGMPFAVESYSFIL
ncbi:GDSL esterase/lipase [Capsicum baccatum]|uniref:GDSL esterase/lipase n=1 Tax=Capsicum baccatum TaxID=33114 RepID=A0A2G2WQ54_CAPBA|nr:GDSL esterase/lipase [Capsicum baccatum]